MAYRFGTIFSDTLTGTNGDDTFYGFAGNDTFVGSAGSDTYNGGTGSDTVDYSQTAQAAQSFFGIDGVLVNLADGVGGEVNQTQVDHFSSIENVTGSNYNDYIVGDGNANIIRGLGGTDFIEGGRGADILDGGSGFDYVSYYESAARVVVDLQSGTGSGGDAAGDTISGFEGIIGSDYNDVLLGNGAGNDISGGAGSDTINGRGGNDRIQGAAGNDILTGGSGADTFVYFSNSITSHSGTDHITDFNVGQDRIEFHAADSESVSFSLVNYNPFTFTATVDIALGSSGHVILDNISLGGLSQIVQSIDIV